jgi:flagellar motor switch protein FliG
MGKRKTIVITAYGHGKTIDKIAVNSFGVPKKGNYEDKSYAETYCNTINSLELKNDSWVRTKMLSENIQYAMDAFLPLNFSDMIMKLDNLAVQKVLREIDAYELAKSLKGRDETVKEKIYANMSKRASKMLKDDIEDMEARGQHTINDAEEAQEKILMVIQFLEEIGEIIIPYSKGETTE